ncbi:MAG TPA: outer membrane protein transport protein [Bdellovibrionales bacterium]|nr:outer membrane protein transport protein [Bdellovibrionales bacterium]
MLKIFRLTAVTVFTLVSAQQAFAAGYEKSIMFGGHSGAFAGIATPWISGSQSLYFNPAGLVKSESGQDISFDISPTRSQFQGPINNANAEVKSEPQVTTPFGLMYGNSINDKFGFGVGYFVSGGSKAVYDNIEFGAFGNDADVKTDLTITEASLGAAYQIMPGLRIGAAYRMVIAEADFAFVQRAAGGLALINAKLTDLKDSNSSGFRFGAQWDVSEATKLGFNYRSEVDLSASGRISGDVFTPGADGIVSGADATASTTFPQQATLGVQQMFGEFWKGLAEYAWTQYSKVDKISVDTETTAGGFPLVDPELIQDWKDQHNIRLAAEYAGFMLPIRFGYGWTSQVTNSDFARASFTAPGPAHTLTAGTGYAIDFGNGQNLEMNGALEYTRTQGDGNGAAAGEATGDIRTGQHTTTATALHLGVAYLF